MINILKVFLSMFAVLLLASCSAKIGPDELKSNKKIFADEDMYIMFALRAEQLKEYSSASSIFDTIYEKSQRKEYLYRSLQNDLAAKDNEKVITRVNEISNGSLEDFALIRMKIIALMRVDRLKEAKLLAIDLVKLSNDVNDYMLVSEIYVKLKKYDIAVKYLESAYVQNYNEKVLDKMSIVLYVNLQRQKDAIAQLETHTRIHGCSQLICRRLIGFYSNENNIDGLLSVYLRLYSINSDREIAKKIVQIYGYKKEYLKLIDFLEESKSDNELLIQLYINSKNYKKAAPLAYKLYKQTGNIDYLGRGAIFEYESTKDKNAKLMQERVISNLEKVLNQKKIGLYLNYLGYLLIDHEIDIKKGMKYVREALKLEPNSAFYLDSLAWGYYKLGNCKKASNIIKKVQKLEGGDDTEVLSHVKIINKCVRNKKGKKKK